MSEYERGYRAALRAAEAKLFEWAHFDSANALRRWTWEQYHDADRAAEQRPASRLGLPMPMSGPPKTPAGRMELVSQLLAPEYVETCPHCGSEVVRHGEPLISTEGALQLLEGEER